VGNFSLPTVEEVLGGQAGPKGRGVEGRRGRWSRRTTEPEDDGAGGDNHGGEERRGHAIP
jgi:hypothetical protein